MFSEGAAETVDDLVALVLAVDGKKKDLAEIARVGDGGLRSGSPFPAGPDFLRVGESKFVDARVPQE